VSVRLPSRRKKQHIGHHSRCRWIVVRGMWVALGRGAGMERADFMEAIWAGVRMELWR
jgi:hypothetical protein